MTSGKIRVCVLEGHQAELASAGLPLSVCLRLQELGLPMSAAQWSTRQTKTGFSVSFFWPSSTNVKGGTMASQQRPRNRRRRRRRRRAPSIPKTDVPSRACDLSPGQGSQNSCFATTSPINAHQPPSPPTTVLSTPSEYPNITDSVAPLDISSSSSVSSCHDTEAEASKSESPSQSESDSGWTVVSPRKKFRGPRVPQPYFRMPSHLWPPEIQNLKSICKLLHLLSLQVQLLPELGQRLQQLSTR